MKKAVITTLAIGAIAMTAALASSPVPGPVDIAACSVASRAALLQFAQSNPGISHIEACKASR